MRYKAYHLSSDKEEGQMSSRSSDGGTSARCPVYTRHRSVSITANDLASVGFSAVLRGGGQSR
jgi:hypothetical protein